MPEATLVALLAAAEDVSASDGSYELPLDPGYYTVRSGVVRVERGSSEAD